jgi:hypothetical protein
MGNYLSIYDTTNVPQEAPNNTTNVPQEAPNNTTNVPQEAPNNTTNVPQEAPNNATNVLQEPSKGLSKDELKQAPTHPNLPVQKDPWEEMKCSSMGLDMPSYDLAYNMEHNNMG